MPQITAIESQKRKSGRFNIFLDGKFAFGISESVLVEKNLKIGKALTLVQVTQIINREELSKLTDLTIRFLNYRQRSEEEVRNYLAKKIALRQDLKFAQAKNSHQIDLIINKLKKLKFLNDFEFTKWYIASRARSRPRGNRLIVQELKSKGIDQDIIQALLAASTDEKKLAIAALSKKIDKWHNLSPPDLKKKSYRYLASRGFDFETIKETVAFLTKRE